MIGRFQVMALLQAARAYVLDAPLDEAKSFGLNRAIFYAAAKRGFQGGKKAKQPGEPHRFKEIPGKTVTKTIHQGSIGGETAYYVEREGKKRYVMGDEILEPEDFRQQIEQRFGHAFSQAWEQAIQLLKQTEKETLTSRRRFYEQVYKPRRDELAQAWSKLSKQGEQPERSHNHM